MTALICIACPKGCHLTVDEALNVTGHACERGLTYGREEIQNPVRVVTSTVRVTGGVRRRCPVKTAGGIPKALVFEAMRVLDGFSLQAPVQAGQTVVADVCGTGVDFVSTGDIAVAGEITSTGDIASAGGVVAISEEGKEDDRDKIHFSPRPGDDQQQGDPV